MCRGKSRPAELFRRLFLPLTVLALGHVAVLPGNAGGRQNEGEKLREEFGRSRGKSTDSATTGAGAQKKEAGKITLGYSIARAASPSAREPARIVSPESSFRLGDRIRLLLEANCDGYLYIFSTVNGQNPEMIFPDPRLKQGDNQMLAHVPYEYPSRQHPEPTMQWLRFLPPAGTEQLFLVFRRTPLAGIPIGPELVDFCRQRKCSPLPPPAAVWNRLASAEIAPRQIEAIRDASGMLAPELFRSAARGIRVRPEAPKPTVLQQAQAAENDQIVVVINLKSQK